MNRMEEANSQSPTTSTLVLPSQETDREGQVIHLKLKKPKNTSKQVSWDAHTVDNEHMNKKKSKCCCIYEKPKKFGEPDENESSDNNNDECDSCMGSKKTHFLHRLEEQKDEPTEVIN